MSVLSLDLSKLCLPTDKINVEGDIAGYILLPGTEAGGVVGQTVPVAPQQAGPGGVLCKVFSKSRAEEPQGGQLCTGGLCCKPCGYLLLSLDYRRSLK